MSDGKLWPDQQLPGPSGNIHYSDDHTISHRGEKSHHWTVQLRPWDDTWGQVTAHAGKSTHLYRSEKCHSALFILHTTSFYSMCSASAIFSKCGTVCVVVTGSTPGWARWSWIMRTLWRKWWRSLFHMGRLKKYSVTYQLLYLSTFRRSPIFSQCRLLKNAKWILMCLQDDFECVQ